ncbi:MAG: 30S ribosomal protein S7 [Candidatus Anstonellales archaeon]
MKLFNKWEWKNIEVKDPSLKQVIMLNEVKVPHTFGRLTKKPLQKTKMNIVERLINKFMRGGTGEKTAGKVIRTHGRLQGKKLRIIKTVEKAFDMVYERTKENPIQVLVRAIENSAPREDVTRVAFGGVTYQVSVDVSSTRRLDMALRNITLAALMRAFNSKKSLSETLADEIINTAKGDVQNSYAMKKRDEIERIARSAR